MASELLTTQQLDAARTALRGSPTDAASPVVSGEIADKELSTKLIEMRLLNPWQAKQLLDGRTKFTLGKYRIVDSLGQGGMGHVFKAEDQVYKRMVAIKVLPRDRTTPEAIANFAREIQALSSLNHPKLVRAVDAGNDGNVHFLVTEFVPGADLRKLVRRSGPLSMEAAANIISQVAEGLRHAHQQGIVHRDVKPGNVLVTPEGDAKLSDLGLAGPMYGNPEEDPRHGKIVGTADYLSPDHIKEPWNPVPTWDIYSLGCTLYYATTGKVPFPGGTTQDKAKAHLERKPLDPRRLNHLLSDSFVDVIADMMSKEPAERISTALEVIERLAPWARQFQNQRQANSSTPTGPIAPPPPGMERAIAPSALAITPLEPIGPLPPPVAAPGGGGFPPIPDMPAEQQRFSIPVVPPPVISQPVTEWEWQSPSGPGADRYRLKRDTLPDLPTGVETLFGQPGEHRHGRRARARACRSGCWCHSSSCRSYSPG